MREISSSKIKNKIGCDFNPKIRRGIGYADIEMLANVWADDLAAVLTAKRQLPNLKIVRLEDIMEDNFPKNLENYMQLPLRGIIANFQTV